MSSKTSRDLDAREKRISRFIERIQSVPEVEFAVKQITTMSDLLALSRRIGTPVEEIDIILNYRDLNEPFWPWAGMSKQARRYFVHERKLPNQDPDAPGSV